MLLLLPFQRRSRVRSQIYAGCPERHKTHYVQKDLLSNLSNHGIGISSGRAFPPLNRFPVFELKGSIKGRTSRLR